MLYISKGVAQKDGDAEHVKIDRFGKTYTLEGPSARLWLAGGHDVREACESELRPLMQDGLAAANDDDADYLIRVFRLLSGCILATDTRPRLRRGLSANDRRTLSWLRKAGIRLTAAELCYLNDQNIAPEMQYLGKENRQALVERIYTADTIEDGALEACMETSRALPETVGAILRLFERGYLFLL